MNLVEPIKLLDHGHLKFIEHWGTDSRIIEAARQSTGKGFLGWGGFCSECSGDGEVHGIPNACVKCNGTGKTAGDEKLLRYLYENKHATPFEFAGLIIEVQAPIFVFREWHRHRTQCLAPNTMIHFDAPKSKKNRHCIYKMSIEEIWKKWQPTERKARPERQTNAFWPRSRIEKMQLRCANEYDREIEYTRITNVIKGENKPMITITTSSGRTISATREHKFFTVDGWMTLDEVIKNQTLLLLEGTKRKLPDRWPVVLDLINEKWEEIGEFESRFEISDQGRLRFKNGQIKPTTVADNGYNCINLYHDGKSNLRNIHTLVLEAFVSGKPPGMEARHLNNNKADNRLENLSWGYPSQNKEDMVLADRQQRLRLVEEKIVQVVNCGILPSYDLTVEGPYHNFIANGFVVHNSYNEMSARYTPLPDLNYVPTVDRLLIGSDGKNKQAGTIKDAGILEGADAEEFQNELIVMYGQQEEFYQKWLKRGVPKELARIDLPVGRYSRMWASANLRNWLAFLTLRMAPQAQFEIRQYANAVGLIIEKLFPRTWELFAGGKNK